MLEVCVGTSQIGMKEVAVSGSGNPLLPTGSSCANGKLVVVLSRASIKNASGAAPVFVIVTGTVAGTPAGKIVVLLFGTPDAETLTRFSAIVPVNGCEISFPATGLGKYRIKVQIPGTGLRV